MRFSGKMPIFHGHTCGAYMVHKHNSWVKNSLNVICLCLWACCTQVWLVRTGLEWSPRENECKCWATVTSPKCEQIERSDSTCLKDSCRGLAKWKGWRYPDDGRVVCSPRMPTVCQRPLSNAWPRVAGSYWPFVPVSTSLHLFVCASIIFTLWPNLLKMLKGCYPKSDI